MSLNGLDNSTVQTTTKLYYSSGYNIKQKKRDPVHFEMNASTDRLKCRLLLRQMRESALRQILQVRVNRKRSSLLIDPNDVVRYGVTSIPAFCRTQRHFR